DIGHHAQCSSGFSCREKNGFNAALRQQIKQHILLSRYKHYFATLLHEIFGHDFQVVIMRRVAEVEQYFLVMTFHELILIPTIDLRPISSRPGPSGGSVFYP